MIQRRLGHVVRENVGKLNNLCKFMQITHRPHAIDAAHVDNVPPDRLQVRHGEQARVVDGAHVRRHHTIELGERFGGRRFDCAVFENSGAVDLGGVNYGRRFSKTHQNVEATECVNGRLDHVLHMAFVSEITGDSQRGGRRVDVGGDLLQSIGGSTIQHERRADTSETVGGGSADSAACSGD